MKQTEKFSASPSLSKEYRCSVTGHKNAFIRLDIACTGFGMNVLKPVVNGLICRGYFILPVDIRRKLWRMSHQIKDSPIINDLLQRISQPSLTQTSYSDLFTKSADYLLNSLTTGWTVRDRIPVRTRFSARPDRPWGPPSLLQNGYRVFPGGKVRPGRSADHSPPFSAAVMEE